MKTVHIETSIVSYLTALPARDLLVAAWQSATLQWWQDRRPMFELCTSRLVLDEASDGHPEAADRRMRSLAESLMEKEGASGHVILDLHARNRDRRANCGKIRH